MNNAGLWDQIVAMTPELCSYGMVALMGGLLIWTIIGDLFETAEIVEAEEDADPAHAATPADSEAPVTQQTARYHADQRAAEVIDIEMARRAAHKARKTAETQLPLEFDEETDRLAESMSAD